MKYYITIITSLILSAVLLINNTVSAASITPQISVSPTSIRAYLDEEYIVQRGYDSNQYYPLGDNNIVCYTFTVTPHIKFGTDGFTSGSGIFNVNFTINTPSGWTKYSIEKDYDSIFNNNLAVSCYSKGSDTNDRIQMRVFASNCYFEDWQGLGDIKVHLLFTYPQTVSNTPDPDAYIGVTASCAWVSQSFNLSPNPQEMGLVSEIMYAIDHTNTSQDQYELVTSIVLLVTNMRQDNDENFDAVLNALSSNNQWNAILSSWLNSISTDTLTISQNTTEMLSFLSTYLPKISSIDANVLNIYNKFSEFFTYYKQQIEKGNTAASSAVQDVQSVESKADIINDIYKPPVDGYLDEVNLRITPEVSGGMQTFLAFINRPYFVLILTMVFSLAFVSYLLYGKGV